MLPSPVVELPGTGLCKMDGQSSTNPCSVSLTLNTETKEHLIQEIYKIRTKSVAYLLSKIFLIR